MQLMLWALSLPFATKVTESEEGCRVNCETGAKVDFLRFQAESANDCLLLVLWPIFCRIYFLLLPLVPLNAGLIHVNLHFTQSNVQFTIYQELPNGSSGQMTNFGRGQMPVDVDVDVDVD